MRCEKCGVWHKTGYVHRCSAQDLLRRQRARLREQWRVDAQRPAELRRREADDLLVSELGPSLLALVEIRDGASRAADRMRAAQLLIERVLGSVQGPAVTVNVDSSLMALARRLDGEGLQALREQAARAPQGTKGLPSGPPDVEG